MDGEHQRRPGRLVEVEIQQQIAQLEHVFTHIQAQTGPLVCGRSMRWPPRNKSSMNLILYLFLYFGREFKLDSHVLYFIKDFFGQY
jgi:hypothetical protein